MFCPEVFCGRIEMASMKTTHKLRDSFPGRSLNRSRGFLLLLVAWSSVAWSQYGGGSGTETDPYRIDTAEQLAALGERRADWDKHFIVMSDIDLQDYDENNFHLIGHYVEGGGADHVPFTGTFDGNGKVISNFSYRDYEQNYVGLFQYATIGRIKNVRLANVKVIGTGPGTGSLVGCLDGASLDDCEVRGANVSGESRVGGLVGEAEGGLARCSARGRVSGVRYVGGLIGYGAKVNVVTCYSKATVFGSEHVGGLIGAITHEYAVVNSCYANGDVQGTNYVGGVTGSVVRGRLYKSYSTGTVSGSGSVGGLNGGMWALGSVITSFWDMDTSGQATSVGGTGKTTDEMYQADTYFAQSGWDQSYWIICEGMNYPIFRWQIPLGDLACPDGVELIDFAWFAQEWRRGNCNRIDFCNGADLDESGTVDALDLAVLAMNWLVGTD
jgi:hypothetical protein